MNSMFEKFDDTARQERRVVANQGGKSLYWAYGSNLSVEQMQYRCPDADKVKALPVYGCHLIFRGVADVELTDNQADVCLGGLWRISAYDERALDRYEGIGSGMYSKMYFYIRDKSRHYHKVLFYKMNSKGIFPPGESYLAGIVDGYNDFALDISRLDEALQRSWDDKQKTEDMRQRFLRKRPVLARDLQTNRPMLSTSKPPRPGRKAKKAKPTVVNVAGGRPADGGKVPVHNPGWPTIGPHSKLLPAPKSQHPSPTTHKMGDPMQTQLGESLTAWRQRVQQMAHSNKIPGQAEQARLQIALGNADKRPPNYLLLTPEEQATVDKKIRNSK